MVKGTRFYYNDGHIYPVFMQTNAGSIEFKAPASTRKDLPEDVVLEVNMTDGDLIATQDYGYVSCFLTKQAVEDMITYLKNTLEEK